MAESQTLHSVRNAVRLLKAFSARDRTFGVSELARRLDISTSTTHRLLSTLAAEHLIEQDPETGRYRLGLAVYDLVAAVSSGFDLTEAVLPPMTVLRNRTGETVQVGVLDGRHVVYVERLDSPHTLRLFLDVGRRNWAHSTGTGKALLAHVSKPDLDRLLDGWEMVSAHPPHHHRGRAAPEGTLDDSGSGACPQPGGIGVGGDQRGGAHPGLVRPCRGGDERGGTAEPNEPRPPIHDLRGDGGSRGRLPPIGAPTERSHPMSTHADIAANLHRAMIERRPIDPITDGHPDFDVADAYRVQQDLVARIIDHDGGGIVGYKLGLTSKPMQEMLGVDVPDYAPVLSSMVYEEGQAVDLDRYIQPRVEAEIALVLDKPLQGPGVTAMHAWRAIGGAVAAIEMVDSRIRDWKIGLVDTISDLASSGATILGSRVVPLEGWDPRLVGMVISRNGSTADTGAGAAALGNPIAAVAWLANTLAPFEVELQAGWFIMTGSLHRAFPVEPGDIVRADFDRLGPVTTTFRRDDSEE